MKWFDRIRERRRNRTLERLKIERIERLYALQSVVPDGSALEKLATKALATALANDIDELNVAIDQLDRKTQA